MIGVVKMENGKIYFDVKDKNGVISISSDVIAGIVAQACLDTKGISSMASSQKGAKGTVISADDDKCVISAYVMVTGDCVIADVAKTAQQNIKSAVEAACGLTVSQCDVYVAGIELKK